MEQLFINDYNYELPQEKIATHPLAQRDASKLLMYKSRVISESVFSNIVNEIPDGYSVVFNNTKVIRARMFFTNTTGAIIEIFLLEPLKPSTEFNLALQQTGKCEWLCYVNKPEKWREEKLTSAFNSGLFATEISVRKMKRRDDGFEIEFSWNPVSKTFAEILELAGHIPLPPYMKRSDIAEDAQRYQTTFGLYDGSVAAPTASLHFTDALMKLVQQKFATEFVTLHVGAGTFKPVKTETVNDHHMHAEKIIVSKSCIENLLDENKFGKIIAAGTTAARTLESIYWWGVMLLQNDTNENFHLNQWYPYEQKKSFTRKESLSALLKYLNQKNFNQIEGSTQLIIVPGYEFKMIHGLITNFHQPKSTLLLLVAALVGSDWKKIYDYALANHFRFLSYGDGNLLIP